MFRDRSILLALGLVATVLAPSSAEARRERVGHIPNGNAYTCDACHGRASLLPRDLTPFGVDSQTALSGGVVQWSQMYNTDSDGDGFTNGQELNDPSGSWRRGDNNPGAPFSNPGIPNTFICGNGILEDGEECDGTNLFGESCSTLGLGEGTLECRLCRHFAYGCGTCGDGIRQPLKEDCDGDDFGDVTCEAYGFLRGALACNSSCEVDSSDCNSEPPPVCGDGVISRGELCDGDNFGGIDCQRLAYAGGALRCDDQCQWDATGCIADEYTPIERPGEDMGSSDSPDAGSSENENNGNPTGPYNYDALDSADSSGCSATSGGASWLALVALAFFWRRRR